MHEIKGNKNVLIKCAKKHNNTRIMELHQCKNSIIWAFLAWFLFAFLCSYEIQMFFTSIIRTRKRILYDNMNDDAFADFIWLVFNAGSHTLSHVSLIIMSCLENMGEYVFMLIFPSMTMKQDVDKVYHISLALEMAGFFHQVHSKKAF